MTCEETAERLAALLDAELSEREAAGVEAHVASCAACAAELAEIQRLRGLLGRALATPGQPADPARFAALWERIEADGPRDERVRPIGEARRPEATRRRWVRVLTGAIAAGVAVGVWFSSGLRSNIEPSAELAAAPSKAPVAERMARGVQAQGAPAAAKPTKSVVVARQEPEAAPKRAAAVANVTDDHGPEAPADLRRRAQLFLEYPIVRRLDELEHFEDVMVREQSGRDRRS